MAPRLRWWTLGMAASILFVYFLVGKGVCRVSEEVDDVSDIDSKGDLNEEVPSSLSIKLGNRSLSKYYIVPNELQQPSSSTYECSIIVRTALLKQNKDFFRIEIKNWIIITILPSEEETEHYTLQLQIRDKQALVNTIALGEMHTIPLRLHISFSSRSHLYARADKKLILFSGVVPEHLGYVTEQLEVESPKFGLVVRNGNILRSSSSNALRSAGAYPQERDIVLARSYPENFHGICPGSDIKKFEVDTHPEFSVALWMRLDNVPDTTEACILCVDLGSPSIYLKLTVTYYGSIRITITGPNGQVIDFDYGFQKEIEATWQHVVASFNGGSYLYIALNGKVKYLEGVVPASIYIPKEAVFYCAAPDPSRDGYFGMDGQVANVLIQSRAISPSELESLHENFDGGYTQDVFIQSTSNIPKDTTLLIIERVSSTPEQLREMIQSICYSTSSAIMKRINKVVVAIRTMSPLYKEIVQSSMQPCRVPAVLVSKAASTWTELAASALEEAGENGMKESYLILIDSRVLVKRNAIKNLMKVISEGNQNTIFSGMTLNRDDTVHSLGYEFRVEKVAYKDLIVPVLPANGYPVMHSRSKNHLGFWTLSGHIFGGSYVVILKLLQSFIENRPKFELDVPEKITDADFFMFTTNKGMKHSITHESRGYMPSAKAEDILTSIELLNLEAVEKFNEQWPELRENIYKTNLSIELRYMMHCAGSMGGEALYLIGGLEGHVPIRTHVIRPVPYCEHYSANIWTSPKALKETYSRLRSIGPTGKKEVVVFHRDYRALMDDLSSHYRPSYVIGRYMFEGNGTLNNYLVAQSKHLDEIWVPSKFHKDSFIENGIEASKIVIIPEAIDSEYMLGMAKRETPMYLTDKNDFIFLSVFKMEDRKGWRELVASHCFEFSSKEEVLLVLHTYIHNDYVNKWNTELMMKRINDHLDGVGCKIDQPSLRPRILIIGRPLATSKMISLYLAADAYVAAHWAEGWGLPLHEATVMGLPVITTNYSGNTEFMSDDTAYLVPISRLEKYPMHDEWFGGMLHGVAHIKKFSKAMRKVFKHRDEARKVATRAQKAIKRYDPDRVASTIVRRLVQIDRLLQQKEKEMKKLGSDTRKSASDMYKLDVHPGYLQNSVTKMCVALKKEGNSILQSINLPRYGTPRRIALVSTYKPRRCGIAMFAENLIKGFQQAFPGSRIDVIALTRDLDHYDYDPLVVSKIRFNMYTDYVEAAHLINMGNYDFVSIQHEFGIWGPKPIGDFVICMLNLIRHPVVVTMHTVLERLEDRHRCILQQLSKSAAAVVVMTRSAQKLLEANYFIKDNVYVVDHGVPFISSDKAKREDLRRQMGWVGKIVIMSNGLIHKGKGYHIVLEALKSLVNDLADLMFCIIGRPHDSNFEENQKYYEELMDFVKNNNLENNVQFLKEFYKYEELAQMLQAGDIFVTPYEDDSVSSSGTLSMAMAAGLPVVSTPFLYAIEVLQYQRGVLAEFRSIESFEKNLRMLIENPQLRIEIGKNAMKYMKEKTWEKAARRYANVLKNNQDTAVKLGFNVSSWPCSVWIIGLCGIILAIVVMVFIILKENYRSTLRLFGTPQRAKES